MTAARRRAVVLAGHAGDVDAARAGLDDAAADVRAAALGALARCDALGPSELEAGLRDEAAIVRRRAAEEAGRLVAVDDAASQALLALLDDTEVTVVEAAAHALGELSPAPADAVPRLAHLVTGHGEVVVRETAVAALGSLGDERGRATVLAATNDVATVRRRAVLALAAFDGDDIEAALQRLADDRDRQVRQAAEDLLHGWGSPEGNA